MIEAVIIAIIGLSVWAAHFWHNFQKCKTALKLEENKDEAEKIVKSKTAGELVDDFNKRYPSDGS